MCKFIRCFNLYIKIAGSDIGGPPGYTVTSPPPSTRDPTSPIPSTGTRFNRKCFGLKNVLGFHFHYEICLNYPFLNVSFVKGVSNPDMVNRS